MPHDPTGQEHLTPVAIRDTSATERAAFRRCRRQWFLSVVHRLQSVEGNLNFWFGTLIHGALEEYYQAQLDGDAHAARVDRAIKRYLREYDESLKPMAAFLGFLWARVLPEYEALGNLGVEMLEAYFDREVKDPLLDEVVEVEKRVWVPIRSRSGQVVGQLSVRTDVVGRRAGDLVTVDHKTASREMSASQLDLDDQLTAEVYAVWMSRDDGEFPYEAIYNVLMKKVPKPPKELKPLKNGTRKLSKDKDQLTTYDLYMAEIKKLGLDAADYVEILQHLHDEETSTESRFFRRDHVMRSPAQMAAFEANLYQEWRDMRMVAGDPQRAYPNPSPFSCPSCPVRLVCTTINDDGDVPAIIQAQYTVGDPRR